MNIRLIIAASFFATAALAANPGANRVLGVTEGGTGTPNGPAAVPFTATGAMSAAPPVQRAGHTLNVIDDFGAIGGGQKSSFAVTCAAGSGAVTLNYVSGATWPAFSSADIGKIIDLPGCGATYTLKSIALTVAGAGYNVGDILTVPGGTGAAATLIVVSTFHGGAIDELGVQTVGSYSAIPTGTLTATSSTGGSGAQFTLTFQNILATTIQSVTSTTTLTVAANAGASQSAAMQNVTWGWDDTVPIQNALNSCRYIQLANGSFLVQKVVFPTCPTTAPGTSAGGLIGNAQSVLIAIAGADNGFLAATKNWAADTPWDDAPYFVSNVTFDANMIAIDAVDDLSFQSRYTMTHFVNALRFGHNMAGYTRNFVTDNNTGTGQQSFIDTDATGNGLDGFHGDPNYTLANGVVSRGATDFRFEGGGAFLNGGYGRNHASTAGMLVRGVHDWANKSTNGLPGGGTYGADVMYSGFGYGSAVTGNIFEGGVIIDGLGTSRTGLFGPGNQLSGNLVFNGRDNQQGETLTSLGNVFYTCNAGLYNGYNGSYPVLVSSGDSFQCSNFSGSGGGWQMWAKDVTVYYGAQQGQTYRCTINGFIRPNGYPAYPCTDFEVPKTASAAATSLTFTITATGQQMTWLPGAGFQMLGQLEVSSYNGTAEETYRADVIASFAYASGTTTVAHKAAIFNAQDSATTPTITASVSCTDATVSSSANNVETCVVTVNFPAAANANMTNARFKAHFNYDQIVGLTVQ